MSSFLSQLSFELKHRFTRPSGWIYFSLYFVLAFFMAILFAGAFEGFVYNFGLSSKVPLNSPIVINQIIGYVGYMGFLVIAPVFGESIHRDFENGFHQVLFACPIEKRGYFAVRFLGSFLSCLFIFSSIGFATYLATFMPFIDRTLVAQNHLWYYVAPYLTGLIPNLFVFGALFMAVVSMKKKMAPVYVLSIALFTGFMISGKISDGVDNLLFGALSDPFGLVGAHQITRYWSLAEQKAQVVPLVGNFLINRLFWVGAGAFFLFLGYTLFNPFHFAKEKKKQNEGVSICSKKLNLLKIHLSPDSWKVFWQLALSEFKQAFSNLYFLIILLCGIFYVFAVSGTIGKLFGTETLPVTYQVLDVIKGSFGLFVLIITTFYGGELVWKDRGHRIHELIDSKPVSPLFLYLSKLGCLFLIQLFLIGLIFASSVLFQICRGYHSFEWSIYAKGLLIYTLPGWILRCVFVLWAQTVAKNKHLGHCFVLFYYCLIFWLPSFGFDQGLYLIGRLPTAFYSDMNGFGPIAWPFSIYTLYWGSFHFCLAIVTVLLWQRGVIIQWKDRICEFRTRIAPVHKSLLSVGLSAWLLLGGFIYYNTHVLNTYKTKKMVNKERLDYEIGYSKYKARIQPKLSSVVVEVDLFPHARMMKTKGTYQYTNQSNEPIETLVVNLPSDVTFTKLEWSKSAKVAEEDERLGVKIYGLDEALLPGESVSFSFSLIVESKGFQNLGSFSTEIVENGTFFNNSDYFPSVGYNARMELSDAKARKKHHLEEKEILASIDNTEALSHNFFTKEGDWIDFEATVSTCEDQIAIAPGYLEAEWVENGRRYFHYKMDCPMLPFYAILSGRYVVARDTWNGVNIEIFHHPTHTLNIDAMIDGVKKSLDYYTTHFSPYQFRQMRIIEFPRYRGFAQSFPNTVPYSESLGFIAKVDPNDPEDINYPFYITAHEVAHQWWGHQVVSGMVQGASMLSESLAQYSALMVLEKEVGEEQMQKFLKYELDKYLYGRSMESKKELPLMLNENQAYICYQKGTLAFYHLKDVLGEEKLNAVLRDYIDDVAFQKPPFTRSVDLVSRLKEKASAAEKRLVEELFETITLYVNRTASVTYKETESGQYEVTIQSLHQKWRCDEEGNEYAVPVDDSIDVGIYNTEGNLIYLEKHNVVDGLNTIKVVVDQEPAKGGVDPLNKLIDRFSSGHLLKAHQES